MKTITAKRITKKEIQAVLRSLDATAIYRLHYKLYGTVSACGVFDFVKQYAPSKRVRAASVRIAFCTKNMDKRMSIDNYVRRKHGTYHGNDLIDLVNYVKQQCAEAGSAYAKRPMMGKTHLYFCSPIYGHDDYNKVRDIPIAGNERLCELLIRYADKYFAPIYGK